MTTQTTVPRRPFAGFACYDTFLGNDPYYYTSTKWHQRLKKRKLKCRPFRLRQMPYFLFVVHDTQSELLATRLSVDLTPWHEEHPAEPFFQHLYQHNILTYRRSALEQEALNSGVLEKLFGLIHFDADAQDLAPAISALDVHIYAPASWESFLGLTWRLDQEPGQ